MAMDALSNIATNAPGWVDKLSDLGGQIDKRQIELAALEEGERSGRPRSIKSLKRTGSTESLRPRERDEAVSPPNASPLIDRPTPPCPPAEAPPCQEESQGVSKPPTKSAVPRVTPAPARHPVTSTDIKIHSKEAIALAQARARAQVRKRHRSQSIVSIEGNPGAYRSRSMIIVYYDSFVQGVFEELVKFVSASRNLIRKAKMAAKVAHIKRLAEMETPDSDDEDDDSPEMPSMRYLSARRPAALPSARSGTRGMLNSGPAEFYDQLDKCLEIAQSTAERAAHQFLRDGDCNEEISKITDRLNQAKILAEKEMERIAREEPDLASMPETPKFRMHRPPAVRRDLSTAKDNKDVKDGQSPARALREMRKAMTQTMPPESATPMEPETPAPTTVDSLDAMKATVERSPVEALREMRKRMPRFTSAVPSSSMDIDSASPLDVDPLAADLTPDSPKLASMEPPATTSIGPSTPLPELK